MVDTAIAEEWVKRTLKPFVTKEEPERFVLYVDNLSAQERDEFKKAVADLSGLGWFGLAKATDIWQPVDSGIAQTLKLLTGQKHREWLHVDDNADRWFANENPFPAMDRRIPITHSVGAAWRTFTEDPKYMTVRWRAFQRTGCLLTVDGSDDHLGTPEGLPDYVVPPTSLLDPSPTIPITNEVPPCEEGDYQHEDDITDIEKIEFICSNEGIDTELDIMIDDDLIFS